MRKKKKDRRARFSEGEQVRSLREQDGGATGVVVASSRRKKGWVYSVMFDGWYKIAARGEDELEEVQ